MPLVDLYECDGPECERFTKDYIGDGWIAVPCMSWYDGWKDSVEVPDDREPAYKKCIVFDEGIGSKLYCTWRCFETYMLSPEDTPE